MLAGIGDAYWFEWYVGLEKVLDLLNSDSGVVGVTLQASQQQGLDDVVVRYGDKKLECIQVKLSWSSFFVTLTRKSFDKIMPAFSFQMVSYIHWMNAGGYDYSRHIHNPWLHYLVLPLMKNDVC